MTHPSFGDSTKINHCKAEAFKYPELYKKKERTPKADSNKLPSQRSLRVIAPTRRVPSEASDIAHATTPAKIPKKQSAGIIIMLFKVNCPASDFLIEFSRIYFHSQRTHSGRQCSTASEASGSEIFSRRLFSSS
jgi:hypothetical protein